MTNKEAGEQLLKRAREIYSRDLMGAHQNKSYNLAMRRAQEVVEFCLKGLLRILGIEYPKVHDVSELFVKAVHQRFKSYKDEESLRRIVEISGQLLEAREAAFYLERYYTADDGDRALNDAKFVLEFAESFLKGLK